jgi:hypothetical protein
MQEQDAPCSFAWPFSKQLSAKHKRNKNSVGVMSKLLSWKHTMPKLIQNIKPYQTIYVLLSRQIETSFVHPVDDARLYLIVKKYLPLLLQTGQGILGQCPSG